MKIDYSKFLIFSAFVALSGCGDKQTTDRYPIGSWNFQLQLPAGFQFADQSSATTQDLLTQFKSIDHSRMFFRDPVRLSLTDSLLTAQMTAHGKDKPRIFKWHLSASRYDDWALAGCQWQSTFLACEYKPLLGCLQQRAKESSLHLGIDEKSNVDQSRSLLIQWVSQCGIDDVLLVNTDAISSFKIENSQIFFAPSPILSLVIYPGVWASYEEALVQSIASATLPALPSCKNETGACRESPQLLTECQGCEKLTKGKLYTVFLLETLRQDYDKIRSFVFVP